MQSGTPDGLADRSQRPENSTKRLQRGITAVLKNLAITRKIRINQAIYLSIERYRSFLPCVVVNGNGVFSSNRFPSQPLRAVSFPGCGDGWGVCKKANSRSRKLFARAACRFTAGVTGSARIY